MPIFIVLFICALSMFGCSSLPSLGEILPDKQKSYQKSRDLPALEVPEHITSNLIDSTFNYEGSVSNDYRFLTALADLTIGTGHYSTDSDFYSGYLEQDHRLDGDLYVDGRVGFYYKGRIKGKYLLTAHADTGEDNIEDIFKKGKNVDSAS